MAAKSYFYGLGRRKSATARVRVQSGKGTVSINGKTPDEYFAASKSLLNQLQEPFAKLDNVNKFDVSAVVSGGGHKSQVTAIKLGISKALVEINPDFKGTLKRADLLGRDSRSKERKKFGLRGARKKRQFTKR
ncbi:MAG: 30S ribosomal protein S9 [Candidatus Saccharimonadales bacterium]